MRLHLTPMKMVVECSGDVLLQQAVCVSLHSGVLLGSVCSGLLLGIIAAVLIHTLIIKPRCLSAESTVHDPWSFLDIEETEEEPEQDCVTMTPTEPADIPCVSQLSPSDPPVLSDVSAFALKARVVYPINQRYRPLADGASNPSLHDSASSSSEWPSEDGEDDERSESVSSCCANKAHPNLTFRRAPHYAHTLCYPDYESRLSTRCVTLQDLHQHAAQLQQDRWTIFLQIVRVLFSTEDQLIQQQEKEVEEVKKGVSSELLGSYEGAEPNSHTCSVEELERAGRERLEQTLHTALSFAKQLEHFSKILQSSRPNDVAQEMMRTLIHCLLLVEKQLKVIQANIIQTLYDRQQWWEELSGWLTIKTSFLRQEAELIVMLTSQSVEELTADGQLEFENMEKLIGDLQSGISEELQRCTQQLTQHTLQLISDHCRKVGVRKRKMMKTQNKEKSLLNKSHDQQDAPQFTMVWAELQMKHWTQVRDFELQQDRRLSECVCDLWKRLFSDFSRSLTLLWRERVLSALITSSALSEEDCHTLLNNIQLTLTNQKDREESHAHPQLHMLREQLDRDKQVWVEQEALAIAAINYLGNQHLKVTMATVARQRELQDRDAAVKEKQRHLMADLKRCLTAQHFYNTILTAMKSTQLTETHTQSLQQDLLSDLEAAAELLRAHGQFIIGHTLVHRTHKRLVTSVPSDITAADDGQKERWVKTVGESTCVSRESLFTLIKNYYSQLQTVVTATQLHPPQHTRLRERQRARADCLTALQRELSHWARKPNSAEFYRRVEQQKRRFLVHFEEECVSETVDVQHLTHTIREELRKEEESFLSRLAALTRVSVTHTNATRLKQ